MDQTADINRALVGSVFFHLFILALALYMPKYMPQPPMPVAVFEVQLVDAPQVKKAEEPVAAAPPKVTQEKIKAEKPVAKPKPKKPVAPAKPAKPVSKPPAPVKKLSKVKPIVKPLKTLKKVAPKKKLGKIQSIAKPVPQLSAKKVTPVEKAKDNKALALLDNIDKKKTPSRIEELDQVASLQAKTPVATKDSVALSDKLKTLEEARKTKTVDQKVPSKLIPSEAKKIEPLINKSEKPAEVSPLERLSALEALTDMDQLAALKPAPELKLPDSTESLEKTEIPELAPLTLFKENKSDALDSVAQKLAKLESLEPEKKIELLSPVQSPVANQEYSSKLREVEISISTKVVIPESSRLPKDTPVTSGSPSGTGKTSSSEMEKIQALYVRAVEEKIMSKWKNPLASEEKQVQVSFYIYRVGKIDAPRLIKKSGIGKLDSLAVQAILDAEPFPEFPKELALTNMHLTINFTYKLDK